MYPLARSAAPALRNAVSQNMHAYTMMLETLLFIIVTIKNICILKIESAYKFVVQLTSRFFDKSNSHGKEYYISLARTRPAAPSNIYYY